VFSTVPSDLPVALINTPVATTSANHHGFESFSHDGEFTKSEIWEHLSEKMDRKTFDHIIGVLQ